jgi:aminoglycoside phosphotransferase (APT) family kinase protein
VPSGPVADYLQDGGFSADGSTTAGQLRHFQPYVADPALTHLEPGVTWLLENQPSERGVLSVCHGDFHPGNVMVDDGEVTGVLDWPGAQLADPEYDVAVSLVLMAVAGPSLAKDVPADAFEAFATSYVEAYSRRRALDPGRLRYYRAYRAIRAFIRGTAARTPGVEAELLPRDQYPWAEEGALHRLAGVIKETTGIDQPLPPGVAPA